MKVDKRQCKIIIFFMALSFDRIYMDEIKQMVMCLNLAPIVARADWGNNANTAS